MNFHLLYVHWGCAVSWRLTCTSFGVSHVYTCDKVTLIQSASAICDVYIYYKNV